MPAPLWPAMAITPAAVSIAAAWRGTQPGAASMAAWLAASSSSRSSDAALTVPDDKRRRRGSTATVPRATSTRSGRASAAGWRRRTWTTMNSPRPTTNSPRAMKVVVPMPPEPVAGRPLPGTVTTTVVAGATVVVARPGRES